MKTDAQGSRLASPCGGARLARQARHATTVACAGASHATKSTGRTRRRGSIACSSARRSASSRLLCPSSRVGWRWSTSTRRSTPAARSTTSRASPVRPRTSRASPSPRTRDARGLDAWLAWFHETAVLLHELLADGGSLYVHLDAHAAHYAKVLLDEVFGAGAFQREIVWRIGWVSGFKSRARGGSGTTTRCSSSRRAASPSDVSQGVRAVPGGLRAPGRKSAAGARATPSRTSGTRASSTDSTASRSCPSPGRRSATRRRRTRALVARIVRARRAPGTWCSTVASGSGTTAVVAEKLGRRWIACDGSPVAVHVTRSRLLRVAGTRPFVVNPSVARRRRASSPHAAPSRGEGAPSTSRPMPRPGSVPRSRTGRSGSRGGASTGSTKASRYVPDRASGARAIAWRSRRVTPIPAPGDT